MDGTIHGLWGHPKSLVELTFYDYGMDSEI